MIAFLMVVVYHYRDQLREHFTSAPLGPVCALTSPSFFLDFLL